MREVLLQLWREVSGGSVCWGGGGDVCGSCNRLIWGARDAWSSAPQLSLLQLSCTLLPSLATGLPH